MATQAQAQEQDPNNLSTKEFGSKLDQLVKHHNNILGTTYIAKEWIYKVA